MIIAIGDYHYFSGWRNGQPIFVTDINSAAIYYDNVSIDTDINLLIAMGYNAYAAN